MRRRVEGRTRALPPPRPPNTRLFRFLLPFVFFPSPPPIQDLADKIAQLNSAIDDVSAQLRAQDLAAANAGVE